MSLMQYQRHIQGVNSEASPLMVVKASLAVSFSCHRRWIQDVAENEWLVVMTIGEWTAAELNGNRSLLKHDNPRMGSGATTSGQWTKWSFGWLMIKVSSLGCTALGEKCTYLLREFSFHKGLRLGTQSLGIFVLLLLCNINVCGVLAKKVLWKLYYS